MTYPTISKEDWDRLRELASGLVNVDDGSQEERLVRSLILTHLDSLEEKYGPHPKLFDSRADFLPEGLDPIPWRLKAYEICSENDFHEKLLISSSICQYYIEDQPHKEFAKTWLERFARHSIEFNEPGEIKRANELKIEYETNLKKLRLKLRDPKNSSLSHKNRIKLAALDRHVFRLRESHGDDAPGFDFPVEALRPCSQLIRALYGPNKVWFGTKVENNEYGRIGPTDYTYDSNGQAWPPSPNII